MNKGTAHCLLVVFLALLLGLTELHEAGAAGMTTHGEAAIRAARWFDSALYPSYREWLLANPGALQAGAAFPDCGYAFGFSDAAEAAHWPPYQQYAANYIHARYPEPWDADTQKLAVFLLGVRSHGIADIDWHGLGVSEGFLDVMAAQEFQGSFSAAHDHGDVGGDVMAAYELGLEWMASRWYVPTVDMAQIFSDLGYGGISASDLATYMGLMMAGQRAEKLLGPSQFPDTARLSPFLVSEYQDYFVGGLDAMAIQSAWGWEDMIQWMENGVAAPAGVLAGPGGKARLEPSRSAPTSDLARLGVTVEETARGAFIQLRPPSGDDPDPSISKAVPPLGEDRSITYTSTEPYGYLGTSLASGDFNQDGKGDLVVGSPGYSVVGSPQIGRVRVVYGRSEIAGHEQVELTSAPADITLTGTDAFGRFGWSVAVADLNADGLDDLAVSAPTTDARGYGYRGQVSVFFGRTGGGLSTTPDLTISTGTAYTNLGWSLSAGDLDGEGHLDLIVGSPLAGAGGHQRGIVAVFFSDPGLVSGTRKDLSEADWLTTGENDYDWFGYHAAVARCGALGAYLLVGAPKLKSGSVQGAGRLYAFDLAGGSPAVPVFTITGVAEFDNTGASFAYGDPRGNGLPLLALASPTASPGGARHAGSVALVSLDGLAGDVSLGALAPATTFVSDQAFARLGWRVVLADLNGDGVDDLWLTEPWRQSGVVMREAGAAYLWTGGPSFPAGKVVAQPETALWSLRETTMNSLFGGAIALLDFNGDGSTDVALSARRASTAAAAGGNVRVVIAPQPGPTAVSPSRIGVKTQRTVTITGERFHAEGLSVRLVGEDSEIVATTAAAASPTQIRATVAIPADARIGAYDLVVADAFGKGRIPSGVEITLEPGPGGCSVAPAGSGRGTPWASVASTGFLTLVVPLAWAAWLRRGHSR